MSLSKLIKINQKYNHQQQIQDFLKINIKNNPDVIQINSKAETIKIATIRQITSQLSFKPLKDEKRHFILYHFDKATIPAQNAFLKSLEEPPEYVQIILTYSNQNLILPTISSRCKLINLNLGLKPMDNEKIQQNTKNIYQAISSSSHGELISLASQYKNREDAIVFLKELRDLLVILNHSKPSHKTTKHLQILIKYNQYLSQNINPLLTLEKLFFEFKKVV